MTKSILIVAAISLIMTGYWFSVMTNLKLNQAATVSLITSIDKTREAQSELYKRTESNSLNQILALIDRNQETIKIAIDQNLALSQQINELVKANEAMTAENEQMLAEVKQVLGEHTRSLEQAKSDAIAAKQAAQNDQAHTRQVLKQISKPKKSPWWPFQ